jgi:PAS domain S-box-containing protein
MKKFLNLQMLIFIILSMLGVSISFYYMHKEIGYIDILSEAMESLRARTKLKSDIETLIRISTLNQKDEVKRLLKNMDDTVSLCTGCHGPNHNKSVLDIKTTFSILKDIDFGTEGYYKTLDSLLSLSEEASRKGNVLIRKRIERVEDLSLALWGMLVSVLTALLLILVFFSMYINKRAKRYMEDILNAVMAITDEKDVDERVFKDEFKRIGEAFKNLQRELRIKEEKLRNWADNWQLTFDTVEAMIALCDTKGRILMTNRAFRERFGDTLDGQDIDELIDREFTNKGDCIIKECVHMDRVCQDEIGNKEATIEVSIYPLKNREGIIVGGIWIGHDITKQKELEQRALHSEKMVALGELVAGIAHEINNPLSVVVGYSEMLSSDKNLPEEYQRRLEKIYISALRASNIIKILLEFSRKKPAELKPCDINKQISKTLDIMEYEIRADGVELIKEFQAKNMILADPLQIGQVFVNLVKNAHDAVVERGGKKRILIRTYDHDDHVYAEVSDTGGGIAEEHINRIFEPFFTTKDVGIGTGLGLSITYSIVKAHGGDIVVRNNNEGGATFIVRFNSYTAANE